MKKGLILGSLTVIILLTTLFSVRGDDPPIPDTFNIVDDSTAAAPSASTLINIVTINLGGGKSTKIKKSDWSKYFEVNNDNWEPKSGAYDSKTDTWTAKTSNVWNNIQIKYSPDGQSMIWLNEKEVVYLGVNPDNNKWGNIAINQAPTENFAQAKVKNVDGKTVVEYADGSASVNAQVIPPAIVKQAGGAVGIDFSKEVSGASLSTANGGTINWQTTLSGLSMISQTTPAVEAGKPTTLTILTLPNGQKLEGTEAVENIAELKGKTLKLGNEEYTISEVDLSGGAGGGSFQLKGKEKTLSIVSNAVLDTITLTEEKGETTTTTQYGTDGFGGVISKKTKVEEDGEVQEETVINYETNAEGNVVEDSNGKPVIKETGTAVFEGGEKQYTKYTNRGGAVSYEFKQEDADNAYLRVHVSDDGEKVCIGTCFKDNGEPIEANFVNADSVVEGTVSTYQLKPLQKKVKIASEARQSEVFWQTAGAIALGQTEVQRTIGSILGFRPGWESLSTWLAPDKTNEWRKWASNTFDSLMLAEYVVPKAVCDYDEAHKTKKPGEYAAFIEVAPGITQSVISFQAERAEAGYILCDEETPCLSNYECKKNICTKDGQPASGYLYKLFWGVSAPKDEEFTPYLDENGVAVSFNFKLKGASGEVYLHSLDGILKGAVQLKNGASDKKAIAHYSSVDFNQFCVEWKQPPEDLDGDEISDDCIDIISTAAGAIKYGEGESAGSTTVSGGQVQTNLNW